MEKDVAAVKWPARANIGEELRDGHSAAGTAVRQTSFQASPSPPRVRRRRPPARMAGRDRHVRAAAAFVTGCSSGIGEALAEELADRGWVGRTGAGGGPAGPSGADDRLRVG